MTNAATWMPEKRTQTPSPSPDLIPAKTINRKLTLKLAHQMGALQFDTLLFLQVAGVLISHVRTRLVNGVYPSAKATH